MNITDAHQGSSADLKSREKRYGITMAFRVACFIAMIWVPSPYRWVLLAAAALLPYVAVLFANQADQRRRRPEFEHGGPSGRPELTGGDPSAVARPTGEMSGGSPAPGAESDRTGSDLTADRFAATPWGTGGSRQEDKMDQEQSARRSSDGSYGA